MANFKLVLDAGHGKNTLGKRCKKSIDPKQTREWVLNSRIVEKIQMLLEAYTGYELLRVDDPTGKIDVSLDKRVSSANKFDADFYLSIHHNAGINGGKGGGIEAYISKNASAASQAWQKMLYASLIVHTGLKGNRSKPLAEKNFYVCKNTKCSATLLELGYMDSQVDVPQILSEEYADKCAQAIVDVIVQRGNLKKKEVKKQETKTEEECTVNVKVLKKGSKGDQVKALQVLLIGYGYDCGNSGADGSFGSATEKALKKYQGDHKLDKDGCCGPKTWTSLLGV
jgi:N-acetylmuramoyl-L-alanine amidase